MVEQWKGQPEAGSTPRSEDNVRGWQDMPAASHYIGIDTLKVGPSRGRVTLRIQN
jgi:hypothetical protein